MRCTRRARRSAGVALSALALLGTSGTAAVAQHPLRTYGDAFEARVDRTQPVVRYVVRVQPHTDSLGYVVEMHVRNVRGALRVASPLWAPGAYRVANFHRYVAGLQITDDGVVVPVVHDDSTTWSATVRGREAVVRYEVRYPTAAAAAGMGNYSFLRPDGALLSGAMTYLYIVGQTLAPAHVTFELPPSWTLASGLVPTSDPRTFFAPSYDVLIDCPVLLGAHLHHWPFQVDGVPHRVVYYTPRPAVPFDTTAWVAMHRRVVEAARDVMGRLPYREYTFLYEDGPGGGLEHLNSATMSAPSQTLAQNALAYASLTAHEYFHAWNVKRIRPVELGPFAYDRPVRTRQLWWAEGVTDFFGYELLRRSGVHDERAAINTLAITIQEYLNSPGYTLVSPERASWTTWDPNTVNHGYNVSYYTTGSLLGSMLDLAVRNATAGASGMDDVERALFDRYSGVTGYTGKQLLDAVNAVCRCDMRPFFTRYVSGHQAFDVDTYLKFAGWRAEITRVTTDSLGRLLPDVRGGITSFNGVGSLGSYVGSPARLSLSAPDGSFGKAGLVDGDFITAVNGKPIASRADFTAAFAGAKVGDRYQVDYVRNGARQATTVRILPYERVRVQIVDLPVMTDRQRMVRARWLHGLERHG